MSSVGPPGTLGESGLDGWLTRRVVRANNGRQYMVGPTIFVVATSVPAGTPSWMLGGRVWFGGDQDADNIYVRVA